MHIMSDASPSHPRRDTAVPGSRPSAPQPFVRVAPVDTLDLAAIVPRRRPAARGAEVLPRFDSAQAYKNRVIALVGLSQVARQALAAAKQAHEAGKGSPSGVADARERLAAVRLQLALLRDGYVIPAAWTRAKFLRGEGFDKARFWRDQIEGVARKSHEVPPEATPAKPGKSGPYR